MMAVVLEGVDKSARVMKVVQEERYKHHPV